MDVRLRGERDGIAAAQMIRNGLGSAIVFVTGNEDADTSARIKSVCGVGPVRKPVVPKTLVSAVLEALHKAPGRSGTSLQ